MSGFVKELSELLSIHGGWGLAAVAFYVVRWLYKKRDEDMAALRAQYDATIEKRHDEFTSLLRETQDALTSVATIISKCQGRDND